MNTQNQPIHRFIRFAAAMLLTATAQLLQGAESGKAGLEFFEVHIRPVLVDHCSGCHSGDDDAESPFRVDSRLALIKGGDFGPAIIPGKPAQSLLIQAIQQTHKELRMPPEKGDKLNEDTIQNFRRWIKMGAPWPMEDAPNTPLTSHEATEQITTDHWFYQPRQLIAPPDISDEQWAASPIDRFIFAKLQKKKLTPAKLASRRELIRRATFDLTGLPPFPEEVDNFITDPRRAKEAFATVVDRLLESTTYGERWGRHWLDVARYADTQGDTGDFPIPTAYLYRNWVIDALNADMPYDQFLQQQLAGDLLAKAETAPNRTRELMIATGFVAISRRFGNSCYKDQYLTIENTIDTLGRGIMGVTLRCARCHDHKFDPILASDYYGLYGIFDSTRYPSMGSSDEKAPVNMVAASGDSKRQASLDDHWKLIAKYQYQIRNHFRPWLKPTLDEYREVSAKLKSNARTPQQQSSLQKRSEELLSSYDGKFRELMIHGLGWLKQKKADMIRKGPADEMLYAVIDGTPHDAKLHRRGDPKNLGDRVPRQFMNVLCDSNDKLKLAASGRKELANWLTSSDHPFTARVITNRIWHHHFGRGIVKTVDNLGVQGELPSHPQLLDYLANQLIANNWSLKSMHRMIMLSRTYRLSSSDSGVNGDQDPGNKWLWRSNRRRLDAESIRDAMLLTSGQLDPSRGESHPFPTWDKNTSNLNSPFNIVYPSKRRSVYLVTQRLFKHPFLGLFDGPDTTQTSGSRNSSSVAAQALYLMNSPYISELAEAFAKRLINTAADESQRISLAYQLAFQRPPTPEEQGDAEQYLAAYKSQLMNEKAATTEHDTRTWTSLALMLLTSNEFFFID